LPDLTPCDYALGGNTFQSNEEVEEVWMQPHEFFQTNPGNNDALKDMY
jgi:hypothetical protein